MDPTESIGAMCVYSSLSHDKDDLFSDLNQIFRFQNLSTVESGNSKLGFVTNFVY